MPTPFLFVGGEDLDFATIATGPVQSTTTPTNPTLNMWFVDYTAGRYRAGFARHALTAATISSSSSVFLRSIPAFSASSLWMTARACITGSTNVSSNRGVRFVDANGIPRLAIKMNNVQTPGTVLLTKLNAAGTETTLATSVIPMFGLANGTPDKLDVFINYAASGTFTVHYNGTQIVTYSGDVTTDGVTALAAVDLGIVNASNGGSIVYTSWSEVIVSTSDTRQLGLAIAPPAANGNADTFTSSTSMSSPVILAPGTPSTLSRNANDVTYQKWTATVAGPLGSATWSLNAAVTGTSQMAIYADGGNVPGAFITSSGNVTNPGAGASTYTFASPPNIEAGKVYWIAFRCTASHVTLFVSTVQNSSVNNLAIQAGQAAFPSNGSYTSIQSAVTSVCTLNFTYPAVGHFLFNAGGGAIVPIGSDLQPDVSVTAAQLQQYQAGAAPPPGVYTIQSVILKARIAAGTSGPSKFNFAVRTGGADWLSADLTPTGALAPMMNAWDTNPNTGNAWLVSELAAYSSSFNVGIKSVT